MPRTAPDPAGKARLIKRYDNRKLYDTTTRAYVTLEELARLVARGQDVRVVDQRSHQDITTVVLAQVILESIRKRTADVPLQVLTRLIRLGARGADAWGTLGVKHTPAQRAREESERIVGGLLRRGRLSLEDALALRQEIAQSVHDVVSDTQRALEAAFHNLVDWTERERGVSPAIQALKERLLNLEAYLGTRPQASPGGAIRRRSPRDAARARRKVRQHRGD